MNLENKVEFFYESADKVEQSFYKAFGEGDIHLMKSVFADNNVSYTHPESSTIVGRQNVIDYWEFLLDGINKTNVNRKVLNKICNKSSELHVVLETFEIPEQDGKLSETITTNYYIKQKNGWRLQMQNSSYSSVIGNEVTPSFSIN